MIIIVSRMSSVLRPTKTQQKPTYHAPDTLNASSNYFRLPVNWPWLRLIWSVPRSAPNRERSTCDLHTYNMLLLMLCACRVFVVCGDFRYFNSNQTLRLIIVVVLRFFCVILLCVINPNSFFQMQLLKLSLRQIIIIIIIIGLRPNELEEFFLHT